MYLDFLGEIVMARQKSSGGNCRREFPAFCRGDCSNKILWIAPLGILAPVSASETGVIVLKQHDWRLKGNFLQQCN